MRPPAMLADQLYLAAHDDTDGRPRLSPRAIGLAMAAGLLGELMLLDRITTYRGHVTVIDRRPPADALAHTILDQLTGEPQPHSLRMWLAYLGISATKPVAERLARTGYLHPEEVRRFLRSETRWVPNDMSTAATPAAMLRQAVQSERPTITVTDVALAGLVGATGLDPIVFWGVSPRTIQYRDWLVSELAEPLRELVAETKAATSSAVLAPRGSGSTP